MKTRKVLKCEKCGEYFDERDSMGSDSDLCQDDWEKESDREFWKMMSNRKEKKWK